MDSEIPGHGRIPLTVQSQDIMWCPGIDAEMNTVFRSAVAPLKVHPHLLMGGGKQLGTFPASKLYILAHGHGQMPLFKTEAGTWTAEQLATLLESDGLDKHIKFIELLVCHAGESVGTKKGWQAMQPARDAWMAAPAGSPAKPSLAAKFQAAMTKHVTPPRRFETDPATLLLPLAAQLTQALKTRGYNRFLMISYKAVVSQAMDPKGGVCLDMKDAAGNVRQVLASSKPELKVVWQ